MPKPKESVWGDRGCQAVDASSTKLQPDSLTGRVTGTGKPLRTPLDSDVDKKD